MRGAPHNGLAAAMSRTSARVFESIVRGRPTRPCRECRVHRWRNHSRCHRTTVSGWTNMRAARHRVQIVARAIQNSRSRWRIRGRLTVRLRVFSCCRSARFSRTSSWCPRHRHSQHAAEQQNDFQHAVILSRRAGLNQFLQARRDYGEGHLVGSNVRRSSWHHRRNVQLFKSHGVERITFWLSCYRVNAACKHVRAKIVIPRGWEAIQQSSIGGPEGVRCLRGRARSGRRSPKLQIMLVASPRNHIFKCRLTNG